MMEMLADDAFLRLLINEFGTHNFALGYRRLAPFNDEPEYNQESIDKRAHCRCHLRDDSRSF